MAQMNRNVNLEEIDADAHALAELITNTML